MSKITLIISYAEDMHAAHLVRVAATRGIKVVIWDISRYPVEGEISLVLSNAKSTELTLTLGDQLYSSDQIGGIWWRRPGGAKRFKNSTPTGQYVNIESEFLIRSLQHFLVNSNWVSDPETTRLACRKPVQLQVAKEVGLHIPDSCVTNSPDALMSFLERMGSKPVTMKA